MKTDDKIERLLDMIEHPELYTESEIQQLLEDDECRAYYELMVKTDNAFTQTPQTNVEEALKHFEAAHKQAYRFSWRHVAAIIIGIVMISGITYATISLSKHYTESQTKTETPVIKTVEKKLVEKSEVEKTDTVVLKEKTFDDEELEVILVEIATYYNLKVEYRSDASRHLRLHFHWNKMQSIEDVVAAMNHFDKVNISLANGKMEVK